MIYLHSVPAFTFHENIQDLSSEYLNIEFRETDYYPEALEREGMQGPLLEVQIMNSVGKHANVRVTLKKEEIIYLKNFLDAFIIKNGCLK